MRQKLMWCAALFLASMAAFATSAQAGEIASVTVAPVRSVMMAPKVVLPGTVVAKEDAHIASEVEGKVVWVAQVGDRIRQGDVVARVNRQVMRIQLASDSANVDHLRATYGFDVTEARRMSALSRSGAIARTSADQAISTRDSDKALLAQAVAELAKTRYSLDHADIRAPFPGRVVTRFINPGEYATAGKDIVRLVDIDDIEVSMPVPITDARFLTPGTPVTMQCEDRTVVGKVRAVVPVGDVNSRTVEVRIPVSGKDALVGDAVRVLVPSSKVRRVLAIPRDALVMREDNTYAYRLARNNVAERVAVETGSEDGNLVEIAKGLALGDRVVVGGAERLEPGERVEIGR